MLLDMFQMKMNVIVQKCPRMLVIHDNVALYERNEKAHNVNLLNLMAMAAKNALVFNSSKYKIE